MPVLDRVDMRQFEEQGYVVVDDVLDPEKDIQPIIDEYTTLLDTLTEQWCAEGRLTSTYRDLPLVERLTKILQSGVSYGRHFNIALPQVKITEDTPIHLGPAVFNMLIHPRLLDAAEEIVGSEIYCHPIHNIRLKPPERYIPTELWDNGMVTATPWHQDQGVILAEADQSQILTIWLAITDATAENGCLSVVPGSHRDDLVPHCLSSTAGLHIAPKFVPLDQAIPVPVKRGSMLLMHSKTMHSAQPNRSDTLRWSFDLRYSPIGHATGRPVFPGFVARSRQHPETELHDWTVWRDLWLDTRSRLAAESSVRKFNRWDLDGPGCA
jgi:phytanoyl-CoA hydroxylase